jgi:hypothetical protein
VQGRLFRAGLAVLSVLLAGTFFVVPYLPTNDGPEWVFAAHIENHFSDPATPYYSDAYVPAPQFASRAFLFLYTPLEGTLGWQRGLQVALAVVALVAAWGFVALVVAVDARRRALAFLGFPMALTWSLYMGFWSLALATGVGLFVLALAVRSLKGGNTMSLATRCGLSASLLCVAIGHMFAAVMTGVALAFVLLGGAPRGRRLTETLRVALIGVPAAVVAVASVVVARAAAVRVPFAEKVGWLTVRQTIAVLPQTFVPGPYGRALLWTIGIASAGLWGAFRMRTIDTMRVDRSMALIGGIFLLLAVFAPVDVPGWQAVSERFATPGALLVLAALPLERLRPSANHLATAALFVVSVASLALTYPMHLRLAAGCADAIAGLFAPVRREGAVLAMALSAWEGERRRTLEGDVPMMNPLLHMGALYATVEGGLIPYVFATSSATHPFTQRPVPTMPPIPAISYYWAALYSQEFHEDPKVRRDIDEDLASYGMLYDGVVVLGARAEDVDVWRGRGFVADWSRGGTFLGHFHPCNIDFAAPLDGRNHEPVFDVGWGSFVPIQGFKGDGKIGDDGLLHYEIPQTPCGEVHIRARWAPADPSQPTLLCDNASSDGTITATVARKARRVTCPRLVEAPPATAR